MTDTTANPAANNDNNDGDHKDDDADDGSTHSSHMEEEESSIRGYDDDDASSLHSGSVGASTTSATNSSGVHGAVDPFEDDILARRETRAVAWSKALVLVVLLGSAALAGVLTWTFTKRVEHDNFVTQFEDFSFEISELTRANAANLYGLLESFGSTVTSFVLSTSTMDWPYVTIPHIEIRGMRFLDVSSARSISFSPIVTNLEEWHAYANDHQGWLQESYALSSDSTVRNRQAAPIPTQVFRRTESGESVPEEEQGSSGMEYAPLWQEAHAPSNPDGINFNLYSNAQFSNTFDLAKNTNSAILSPVLDPTLLFGTRDDGAAVVEHPQSILVEPIYDTYDNSTRTVVGAIVALLSWDSYLNNLLPPGIKGVVCVLHDVCGGEYYTYVLDGPHATFLAKGDLHDATYDSMEFVTPFTPTPPPSGNGDSTGSYCEYKLHVYPSQPLEHSYATNRPPIFTAAVILVFLFTSLVFLSYDLLVQRRQRKVHTAAVKSNAIVSSLFPAEIRDRLFQHNAEPEQNPKNKKGKPKHHLLDAANNKFRLKNYLDDGDSDDEEHGKENDSSDYHGNNKSHHHHENREREDALASSEMMDSKPIADLFPNTTVMFADIAGFTAWSSVREPSQVFTLLETVYRAFDVIAKRRRVFKVETVGDCYVAVTGLPEPRKDHAIVMARFARDSMQKMNELSHQLEVTLGPDTGDLAMRFGLHSGPVTAGVLRGDKSRFQLFGDTVNTAARIESTGQRNRIHVSQETAHLIDIGGKSHWLRPRNDMVHAKGKGEMKTFWLLTKEDKHNAVFDYDEADAQGANLNGSGNMNGKMPSVGQVVPTSMSSVSRIPEQIQVSPKLNRLIDWNVDVLQRLLKLIVCKRSSTQGVQLRKQDEHLLEKTEKSIGKEGMVLDEVTEIVTLPKFDARNHNHQLDPNSITIPPLVVAQLREYVRSVAMRYRDNPFHNFEHASHVTMSVSKLLSRIVAPDIDQEDRNLASSLHDHTYGITSDPLTQFAVVLSALIHDVDHVGVPNFLLMEENTALAQKYKNKSVAEQNSVDVAWETLMEPRFSALRLCIYHDDTELKRFRQLMVNTVLATDIFDKELQTLRKNRWDKAFKIKNCVTNKHEDVNRKATIVIEHLIQASDVAHTMQHWHIYQKWNERLFQEMYNAYKTGRSAKDPAEGWYQGELGFFDNYIIPLGKKLKDCGVFGVSSDEYLNYALENRREWAAKGEEVVKDMIDKYVEKPQTAPAAPAEAPVVSTTPDTTKKEVESTGRSIAPTEQSSSTSQGSASDSINPANAAPYDNADH